MITDFLFKRIDNSGLVVFRIFFGLLCFLESVGAILTGWVNRVMIQPKFTFSFIGFEWLQPLPGNWMYLYYVIMGLFGLFVMLGYKYRFSMLMFAVMWTATYLMQKSSYNNHYYLLFVLSFVMVFLPANRYASIDVRLNPKLKAYSMPNWCKWLFVAQLFILYTYASIAKLYPDWLDTSVIALMMKGKAHFPIIGDLLQQKVMHYFIAYGGILFDGLIIPLLLYKPTRKFAFFGSIFFHIFNSVVFHIGIFPFLSLAFCLFFFEPKTVRNLFLRNKPFYDKGEVILPRQHKLITTVLVVYVVVNIALPLRHHFFKDNVLWTEEGHRLAWRMMLRTKSGSASFTVVDKETNKSSIVKLKDHLTKKQQSRVATKPDFIWQFAQYLKQEYAEKGQDVEVFARVYVSVNGKPYKQLIDPKVDLASTEWHHFKHHDWILPSK
ncbi:HTTM domain-containing protein [uncultured Winogradskyella sp.]|uniref:HTTM domain-containing protein n=1 Tax=uncultured Winogradskyella sp. TaxID=395353 RepID=UPI003515D770